MSPGLGGESVAGTSPRMRGKHRASRYISEDSRNIPAYAGKTLVGKGISGVSAEHPRVCGENGQGERGLTFPQGTSPRMRGKLARPTSPPRAVRNIPAYAGKTEGDCLARVTLEEHPRVCGENNDAIAKSVLAHGTSPRMRGKRANSKGFMMVFRNIPAYAGKTGHRPGTGPARPEHPRVCGENTY